MPNQLRQLPIVQHWDCHSCSYCCRGSDIPLDEDDLNRLRDQDWSRHPEFQNLQIVRKTSLIGKRRRLAKKDDGSCIFLTQEGRCRIHQEHGIEAKPFVCRMFPLQVVPLERNAVLMARLSCPSAAGQRGKELSKHASHARKLAEKRGMLNRPARLPSIVSTHRRSWHDTLLAMESLEQLLRDERFPLVRRIVHGLVFADLLEQCKLRRIQGPKFTELLELLRESSHQHVNQLFVERRPPHAAFGALFRQIAFDYLRLHPRHIAANRLTERARMIAVALRVARGKGSVPQLSESVPPATFASLESPLGHLPQEVLRPLDHFFEVAVTSKYYCLLGRKGWPVADSFRGLALTHAVALWLLRLFAGNREASPEMMLDIVCALDRAQGCPLLSGAWHRTRVSILSSFGAIPALLAWYAR